LLSCPNGTYSGEDWRYWNNHTIESHYSIVPIISACEERYSVISKHMVGEFDKVIKIRTYFPEEVMIF
jgi:hypothetical protein